MTEPKLINRKLQNVIIVGLIVLIIAVVINNLWGFFIENPTPPHKIQLMESFEGVWRSSVESPTVLIDSCALENRRDFMRLDTDRKQLILPIFEGNPLFSKLYLTSFDLVTGKINWQIPLGSNDVALGSNSDSVFSVIRETEKCTPDERGYCDAVQVSSYNIFSGEKEWVTYHGKMNRASTLCINDEIISVSGYATRANIREKFSLSADTGEEVAYQDISAHHDNYYQNWNLDQLGFAKSNVVDWSYEQNSRYLYFLTERGKTLWAADPTIPEIVGRVQFDGSPLGQFPYLGEFAVASSDDLVAVYLGDSDQLFVFRFSPDE